MLQDKYTLNLNDIILVRRKDLSGFVYPASYREELLEVTVVSLVIHYLFGPGGSPDYVHR